MIITLLLWFIIFITCVGYGYLITKIFESLKFTEDLPKHTPSSILLFFFGFILVNSIASVLSLFLPINTFAFIIVCVPGFVLFIFYLKDQNCKRISHLLKFIKENPLFIIAFVITSLLSLWLTSGQIQNADTYIYHAQSIHWIEDYPVIIGLGNFFNRLAYNSSWFVQSALFSFSFLGRSFHVLNGLILFLVSIYFLQDFNQSYKEKRVGLLQIFSLFLIIFGIISISTQSSAPSTDMPVSYLSFLAAFVTLKINEQNRFLYLFLISGLIAFAITIKISIAPLAILPILLFLFNVRKFNGRLFITFAVWILLIFTPWMVRNFIISGYAVYPVSGTGLPVEWKIPESLVKVDELGIRAWGFNERESAELVLDTPFQSRIKSWFFNLTLNQKAFVIISLFSPLFIILLNLISKKLKIPILNSSLLLPIISFYTGFIFWILVSPNLRFGYVYILFLTAISTSIVVYFGINLFHTITLNWQKLGYIAFILLISILFYRSLNFIEVKERLFLPQDYETRSTEPCFIDEGSSTILCATDYGECGYYAFPCHAWGNEDVRMYGDNFQDGFYSPKK